MQESSDPSIARSIAVSYTHLDVYKRQMGNKDWSHLRNEHQSRFSKGQPKEAPLEKGSPEKLEDTLAKEPEVLEVPAFQEEVKQEEERKDEPAIGVKKESYDPKEGSFATPEDCLLYTSRCV